MELPETQIFMSKYKPAAEISELRLSNKSTMKSYIYKNNIPKNNFLLCNKVIFEWNCNFSISKMHKCIWYHITWMNLFYLKLIGYSKTCVSRKLIQPRKHPNIEYGSYVITAPIGSVMKKVAKWKVWNTNQTYLHNNEPLIRICTLRTYVIS